MMRGTISRIAACFFLVAGGGSASVPSSAAPSSSTNNHINPDKLYAELARLVDEASDRPPRNYKEAELLLGVRMHLVNEQVFRFYEAHNTHVFGISVESIDYREPPLVGAEAGPYLQINFASNCMSRHKVIALHPAAKFIGTFREGRQNTDDGFAYAENTTWGRRIFVFAQNKCLSSFIFRYKPLPSK